MKSDEAMKNILPFVISDKFRHLANALKVAIPGAKELLQDPGDAGIKKSIEAIQKKDRFEEDKRRMET